jgi:hypothetical protein
VVAQAKAVGVTGVMGVMAPHRAGHRTSPPAMSADATTRWGIRHVSSAQNPRRSRRMSRKTRRRGRSFS